MFVLFQPRSTKGLTLIEHERFGSPDFRANRSQSGFSLVEMAVVIAVILVLAGAASLSIKPYLAYRDGRAAGEMLRAVKAAQLMYLSDNPSTQVANLTQAELLPYMPNGLLANGQVNPLAWPTLPSGLKGEALTIDCTQFPPAAVDVNGKTYDPSGSTTDGLWDVGQY
jgi:prepilin-type N-terminal cleavage/methylation domain-containing protein